MIELRRLTYFVVLAKRLSFSRAADDLGLTQSALSRAIQSLERETGMRLFDRDRSGVLLTEQGRWMVEKAEALLTSAQDFQHQLAFATQGLEGRLSVGMIPIAACALLPHALTGRLVNIPGFTHEVMVRDVETLWLQLNAGEIEFLVCSEWNSAWPVPADLPMRIEPLGTLPVSLIVRAGHPLLSGNPDAERFPLLLSNRSSATTQIPARLRESCVASIQVIEDFHALATLLRRTDAIWLSSSAAVAAELADGSLREAPWPHDLEPTSVELFMYSLLRRTKSPAAKELEQAFRERIRAFAVHPRANELAGRINK